MSGMIAPVTATELAELEDVLRDQWLRLRRWIGALDEEAVRRPSVLPGWSVAELVAHVGRSLDALAACQPAPSGTTPQSLAQYVGAYAAGATDIDRTTRALAADIAEDPLGGVDALAAGGFAQLTVLHDLAPDPVVVARRGPLHLSSMVVTRILELVVHGDDLLRSVGRTDPGVVAPRALHRTSEALLAVAAGHDGWDGRDVEVVDELAWVRLACGRVPVDAGALAAAVRARPPSTTLPDPAALPLL